MSKSKSEERKVDEWNATHEIGVDVELQKDSGRIMRTQTNSHAQLMGGSAVIWLVGLRGCYSLDSITVMVDGAHDDN